ncbi:hypothetical protein ABZW10_28410 [Kitasatospora sp. NPDC004723]|uniref:hypothetical protein n=1 Tax=Kitasatospora sp. NPDC004723 TaxID=3154288 RepID=UPI0033A7518A
MKHRKPELGIVGPLMYSAIIVGSALVALAVAWPVRNGPLGPWLLVVFFVFAAGTVGALPVSDKWLRRRQGSP